MWKSPRQLAETHKGQPRKASAMGYVFQIPVVLCWSLAAAFAAPGDGSLSVTNIFAPLSTPAEAVYEAALLVLVICAGIFLVVGGLLAYTIIRFRRRPADSGREP